MNVPLCRMVMLILTASSLLAQSNPLSARFDRLMGEPKALVEVLLNFPWNRELPDLLPGFKEALAGGELRIVSVRVPVKDFSRWKRWESEDGNVWIDVVRFNSPYGARGTMGSARQPHSGYIWENQLLLFSNTGDLNKEATGTALVGPDGSLLNVGVKLPLRVQWDHALSATDLAALDAALASFQSTLDLLARRFLDPAYVSFADGIKPKPEALPILRTAGFARLWSYVKYNFAYLDKRPDLDWDSVLERYMPRIAAAKDDIEYGRILESVIALLHDGHTNVYPNSVARQDAPAIILEPIDGKPVATIVGNLPHLSLIRPGMELLEIDGTPVKTIMERDLDPYISSGTIQDRQLRRMRVLLAGPPDSSIRTKWLALDGQMVESTLTRNRSQHRDAIKLPPHGLFEEKRLPGDIAYIALNSFEDPAIVSRFEAKFEQLRTAKAWIIDLRENGGGSSDFGDRIISHFISSTTNGNRWRTRLYNPTAQAIGEPQTRVEEGIDKIEPASGPHYDGPIYILTSPSTCSAAEDFVVPLRASKRATVLGEPTCGSTGQPLPFIIYGATGRVCTKWDAFPDGTEFVGVGILPDVPVTRSKKDVATGRDAVLETALALAAAKL